MFNFQITSNTVGKNAGASNNRARTGIFTAPYGNLITPLFSFVSAQNQNITPEQHKENPASPSFIITNSMEQ